MQSEKNLLSLCLVLSLAIGLTYSTQAAESLQGGTGGETLQGSTQTTNPPSTQIQFLSLPDPLHGATIEGLLERIVRWLRNIAAPIAAGMIIYGAYQMLFAAGDPEKFKVGRQTILYTVIGYAIIWIGWGVTSIIKEFLAT